MAIKKHHKSDTKECVFDTKDIINIKLGAVSNTSIDADAWQVDVYAIVSLPDNGTIKVFSDDWFDHHLDDYYYFDSKMNTKWYPTSEAEEMIRNYISSNTREVVLEYWKHADSFVSTVEWRK